MQDLLELCKEVSEEINFAVFQNSLMSSPMAAEYGILLKKAYESELTMEDGQKHLDGALKKIEIEAVKKEMLEITEKIQQKIEGPEDLIRYRALGVKLK